jgi:Tfp pilus assembly protein PilF
LAIVVWFCCYRLLVGSARTGVSRLFSTIAIVQHTLESADFAVKASPSDPEAHYTRALTLVNLERLPEAVAELDQTLKLRPHHYYVWLDRGVTLDRLGDETNALVSLRESVRLAPAFAQPRWQLGNLLFRQGAYDEAFQDLRLAVNSNPSFSEGMLELAWVAANEDADKFEKFVQPQTSRKRFELAAFLARQGRGPEAMNQVAAAGQPQTDDELYFSRLTIKQLLAAQKFNDAYMVWAKTHPSLGAATKNGELLNGSLTDPIYQNDPGFGWQLLNVPNIQMSIDPSGPEPGTRSIQLEYRGDSPPGSQPIQQLVLLAKDQRYSLSFKAKSQDLVTGGTPVVFVLDGTRDRILGQSAPIAAGTTGWTPYHVDFYVDNSTAAINIVVQRLACNQNPCPVFGRLWLSQFVLGFPADESRSSPKILPKRS